MGRDSRTGFFCYDHTCSVCGHRFPITGYCPIINAYALSDGTCDQFKIMRFKK